MSARQEGPAECMRCFRKVAQVFAVTAEDIQREKPPRWITRVCSKCLAQLRADARLESNYHLRRALAEFSLLVPSMLAALAAAIFLTSAIAGRSILVAWHLPFIMGAATSAMGLEYVFYGVRNRYAFTHNLRWSVRSREVFFAFSMALSGALFATLGQYVL